MAKYLPPGYIDCALGIKRDVDPDPYSITFGASIATPPWTQANNDELFTSLTNVMVQALNDDSLFTRLSTKVGSDGEGPLLETTGSVAGLRSGDQGPPNVAYLCRKSTGLGGRYNRGRMYWPSTLDTNMTPSGIMTSGEVTFMQGMWDAMLLVLQNGDGLNPSATDDMVLIHSPRPAEATPTPTPITALIQDDVLATQRRRLRR